MALTQQDRPKALRNHQGTLAPADHHATSWVESHGGAQHGPSGSNVWGCSVGGHRDPTPSSGHESTVPHKLAERVGRPTSGTAKPWGWEWACPLLSALPWGAGCPGRKEERGEGSKRGCQEAPGGSSPFQDSSTSSCRHPTQPIWGLLKPFRGLKPGQEWAEQDFGMTVTVLLPGEAGPAVPRGPFSRILPGSGIHHQPSPPTRTPYHSLERVLSICLRVPSWAGGACRVLPLCRAAWHMPVVGAQRVADFPPAWGEVGVRLQALVTPEVVCAEGHCEARCGGSPPAAGYPEK